MPPPLLQGKHTPRFLAIRFANRHNLRCLRRQAAACLATGFRKFHALLFTLEVAFPSLRLRKRLRKKERCRKERVWFWLKKVLFLELKWCFVRWVEELRSRGGRLWWLRLSGFGVSVEMSRCGCVGQTSA